MNLRFHRIGSHFETQGSSKAEYIVLVSALPEFEFLVDNPASGFALYYVCSHFETQGWHLLDFIGAIAGVVLVRLLDDLEQTWDSNLDVDVRIKLVGQMDAVVLQAVSL